MQNLPRDHGSDVMMGAGASQITGFPVVYSTVCSGAYQRKHQKFCVTCLCEGNSPATGEFPPQRASNAENVSIWWRHYACTQFCCALCDVLCTCRNCYENNIADKQILQIKFIWGGEGECDMYVLTFFTYSIDQSTSFPIKLNHQSVQYTKFLWIWKEVHHIIV